MKRLIANLSLWILKKCGYEIIALSVEESDISKEAQKLCAIEEIKGTSGENKRHQVYSKLIKSYPRMSRSSISIAIEYALKIGG